MKVSRVHSELGPFLEVELEGSEEAVVLSDTHLGLKYRGKTLSKHLELAEFFAQLSQDEKVSLVVLLGDIFELWSASVGDVVRSAYDPLRELARSGKTVVYVAGNHDRIVAHLKLESSRGLGDLYIVPDFFILKAGGRKMLMMHGHQLDGLFTRTRSLWKLQSYVYILSESLLSLPGPSEWLFAGLAALVLVSLALMLPVATFGEEVLFLLAALFLLSPLIILLWRRAQDRVWYGLLEGLARRLLRSRLRGKSMKSISVSKPLRSTLRILEATPEIGRVDAVVIGHTHVPELLAENGLLLANTGSWVENGGDCCTFLRVSRGELALYKWEKGGAAVLGRLPLHAQ